MWKEQGKVQVYVSMLVALTLVVFGMSFASAASGSGTFIDDDNSLFEPEIEIIAEEGITSGCNPPANTKFCPTAHVTRAQMAVFLDRAANFPSTGTNFFTDDNGHWAEASINRIAAAGVTTGCNPPANNHFCPSSKVTRAQMAVFLNNTLGLPSTQVDDFTDDDGHWAEVAINRIAAAGITHGCNPPANTLFCPNAYVTREQMAAFLVRAFDLDAPPPTTTTSTTTTTTVPPTTTTTTVPPTTTTTTVPPTTTTTTVPPTTTTTTVPPTTTTTTVPPPVDSTNPSVVVTAPTNNEVLAGQTVTFEGSASDNVGVAVVQVAVQDRVSKDWLQPDLVSWGSFVWHDAELTSGAWGDVSVGWEWSVNVGVGEFGTSVRAKDAAGNLLKAPWVKFDTTADEPPVGEPGVVVQPWGPRWMADNNAVSEATAVFDAQRFDVLVAHENTYAGHVAAMRVANPNVVVYTYVNAVYGEKWRVNAGHYPESWFLHDATGARVFASEWGNAIMNPADSEWQQNRSDKCADLVAVNGYDGCFLDLLGTGPLLSGQITSAPLDPGTGLLWDHGDWLDATVALTEVVAAGNPGLRLSGNGLAQGSRYFDAGSPTSRLWDAPADWMMAEVFVRGAHDGVNSHRSLSRWLQDVNMLVDAEAANETIVVTAKVWVGGVSQAQYDVWHEFMLASFLLGAGDNAQFVFLSSMESAVDGSSWWNVPLGVPVGGYVDSGAWFERTFASGVVYANPTSGAVQVDLPFSGFRLDGSSVSGTVSVPAYSGLVVSRTAP